MKKILKVGFGVIFAFVMMFPLVVNASKKDFIKDYLNNKLEKPEAPYIKETQYENTDTQLRMYYTKTSELQKLALDIQKNGEDKVLKDYNISQFEVFIQVDAKFNDGEWLSTKGTWDKRDEEGNINYGDNIREWDNTFSLADGVNNDNANKLNYFTQSWLTYYEKDRDFNPFLDDFVATKNNGDNDYYIFKEETTITYRYRWVIKYLENEYQDNQKYVIFTGPWSDTTSIGKNGKQKEINMPKTLKAPKLSEFKLTVDEDGIGDIKYFFELDDSIYNAEKYKLIVNDSFEPYIIEAQVKVNDGKWEDISIANATWLTNGYKVASVGDKEKLTVDDDVYLRVRIKDNESEKTTEWSNIIGTKKTDEKNKEGKTLIEKIKCKLCGICPFQPLGICLFVWIALFVLLLIIILIIAKKNKKNKKQ